MGRQVDEESARISLPIVMAAFIAVHWVAWGGDADIDWEQDSPAQNLVGGSSLLGIIRSP